MRIESFEVRNGTHWLGLEYEPSKDGRAGHKNINLGPENPDRNFVYVPKADYTEDIVLLPGADPNFVSGITGKPEFRIPRSLHPKLQEASTGS